MQSPFISIIIVCLNAGNQLKQTVDSILMQDFTNFEVIIKDGFSTDGSVENISKNDKIVHLKILDLGIYDAMNQALNYTKGRYVLFLNAGDFFYENSVLSFFYETIINNNFPGLIFCDYKTTGIDIHIQSPNKLTNFFLFRTMLCHQVCMINKELYNKLGKFDTTFKVDADYDFLLRLIIQNNSSYKHIKKLGIISTSKGFSYQNSKLAKQEVKIIRKKYFPNMYLIYNSILALTCPSIREKIANESGFLSKIYHRIVNIINSSF